MCIYIYIDVGVSVCIYRYVVIHVLVYLSYVDSLHERDIQPLLQASDPCCKKFSLCRQAAPKRVGEGKDCHPQGPWEVAVS